MLPNGPPQHSMQRMPPQMTGNQLSTVRPAQQYGLLPPSNVMLAPAASAESGSTSYAEPRNAVGSMHTVPEQQLSAVFRPRLGPPSVGSSMARTILPPATSVIQPIRQPDSVTGVIQQPSQNGPMYRTVPPQFNGSRPNQPHVLQTNGHDMTSPNGLPAALNSVTGLAAGIPSVHNQPNYTGLQSFPNPKCGMPPQQIHQPPAMSRPLSLSGGSAPARPIHSGATVPSEQLPLQPNYQRNHPLQTPYSLQPQSSHAQPGHGDNLASHLGGLSLTDNYNNLWDMECIDLLQHRHILPPEGVKPPRIRLQHEYLNNANCSPDVFRCTLTKIPENNSLLQKSRLPLGVLIHPFKDLNHLPVIQCSTIVRCRSCRTYINPFVHFVDQRRWKCNLCFRVNDLPEEFQFDPVTKSYGDPSRRPEVKSSTIEFIAPSEYMLRPPQPAVYVFVLDVSRTAVETGYLKLFCDTLLELLERIPGDSRMQIGLITVDRTVHFYSLTDGFSQPHQMVVSDIDEIFLPCPDSLLVNLVECKTLVCDLVSQLPTLFLHSYETDLALGAALQAAFKLLSPTGGRISVFHASLPNIGPGSLKHREDPNEQAGNNTTGLTPATDFYKRLALECSGQQVAVDLFVINSKYVDLASISCISKFSSGCIYHFPQLQALQNPVQCQRFQQILARYLQRKIGFEAVMRIRCSRGLAIHTFHGHFFVRSTDLLSLPNINPDVGFGMQVSIEEPLTDIQTVCFQAALLYTSSKGERRIRVHTLALPISSTLSEVIQSADQQCIVALLAKMAVDRSQASSLQDAREALINAVIDALSSYHQTQSMGGLQHSLLVPQSLRLFPLYILALLKHFAFRTGQSTRVDDRVYSMCQMKTMPLSQLMQCVYPDLYAIHNMPILNNGGVDGTEPCKLRRLNLSSEKIDSTGAYLMDAGDIIMLYIGTNISVTFCQKVLNVPQFQAFPDVVLDLPELETPESEYMRDFINNLQMNKPYCVPLKIIRSDSKQRNQFIERLVDDRTEGSFSYYEFLQHLKTQVK